MAVKDPATDKVFQRMHEISQHQKAELQEEAPYLADGVSFSGDVTEESTALTPYQEGGDSLALSTLSPEQFLANLKKVQMWTSYTGPVPAGIDEFVNMVVKVKGLIVQRLTSIDEESGEELAWREVRMKVVGADGKDQIISMAGKGALQFAQLLEGQFGQGDWPTTIEVSIKKRKLNSTTKEGQPKYMPVFQVIG